MLVLCLVVGEHWRARRRGREAVLMLGLRLSMVAAVVGAGVFAALQHM